jgi:Ras-related protein Rab-39B
LQFLEGNHFINHGAVDAEPLSRTISHANKTWSLSFMDLNLNTAIAPSYREVLDTYIASADGVILLYDITSRSTFEHLIQHTYLQIWHCRNTVFIKDGTEGRMQGAKKRFGCVVVGNKKDMIDRDEGARQVKKEMADQWAASQGFRHIEVSSNQREEIEDAVRAMVDSVQRARRMDARDLSDSKSDGKG